MFFLIKLFIDEILMAAYLFNFPCLPELETTGMVNIKSQAKHFFVQLGTTNLWFWHGMMAFVFFSINPFAQAARNRPCRSTSLLPLVTSSVLMVKDNFVR